MHQPHSFLALGDSYTIGEGLPIHQSYPYQTVRLLRQAGLNFSAPEIIAKTGWTTDELEAALTEHRFLPTYDFVTLLVGVNNQYRGREIIEYKEQFEHLLKKAIAFAGNKSEHVFVLSIPNYGRTPFAKKLDVEKIGRELDAYNSLTNALSIQFKTNYLDLTIDRNEEDLGRVVDDGLHPAAEEYANWAKKLSGGIKKILKK